NARRRRMGRDGRTSAQAARRRGHGGPPQGRGGRLRQSQGHERGLVSGRQQRRGERARDHELLRQALDDRAGLSRHQGPSFRHGPKRSSHRRSATARPASSPERLRHRSPDAARRRRRKPRHGSPSQGQYRQTPDPFAVPAGLYALRVDPEHAGGPPAAARRAVQRIHHPKQSLGSDLLGRMKNEGMAEVAPDKEKVLLALRFDPELSIVSAAEYGRINLDALIIDGLVSDQIGDDEKARFTYLAHHEGLTGAEGFLKGTRFYTFSDLV